MTTGFGARLRTARERKGIGLDAIAQSTKINVGLFDSIEHDDASRWPSGIFRRAFMRAYANALHRLRQVSGYLAASGTRTNGPLKTFQAKPRLMPPPPIIL